jgi:hypothetical protein
VAEPWLVVVAVLGVVAAIALLVGLRAQASFRRVERELAAVQERLHDAARNVELTLALTEAARPTGPVTEPGQRALLEDWRARDPAEVRESMVRWIEGGQHLLEIVAGVVSDYNRLREEIDRARGELARVEGEVARLVEERDRFVQERSEIAETLEKVVKGVLAVPRP